MDANLVTTRVVAKRLQVSEATVRSYARDGLLPCIVTFGGHRRFPLADVLEVWEARIHAQHGSDVAHKQTEQEEVEELKPIEVSTAWKNDWAISAFRAGEDEGEAGEDQHVSVLQPEPFPGVRGKTRFVVSRRLVGV